MSGLLTIDQIRDRLQHIRPEVVAAETGLGISTIYKYRNGEVAKPPLATVQALSDYLSGALTPETP